MKMNILRHVGCDWSSLGKRIHTLAGPRYGHGGEPHAHRLRPSGRRERGLCGRTSGWPLPFFSPVHPSLPATQITHSQTLVTDCKFYTNEHSSLTFGSQSIQNASQILHSQSLWQDLRVAPPLSLGGLCGRNSGWPLPFPSKMCDSLYMNFDPQIIDEYSFV